MTRESPLKPAMSVNDPADRGKIDSQTYNQPDVNSKTGCPHEQRAGDCISGAHASQPWGQLGRFFATTVLASFVLNEIWEMAQMAAYVETEGKSWTSTFGLCSRAAVGDVGIILDIYASGALAAGDPGWGLRGRYNIYATAAVMGLAYAALVELAALASGRLSYTERMPVVAVLGVGLWPLLQMTLRLYSRSYLPGGGPVAGQLKELYDEPYRLRLIRINIGKQEERYYELLFQ